MGWGVYGLCRTANGRSCGGLSQQAHDAERSRRNPALSSFLQASMRRVRAITTWLLVPAVGPSATYMQADFMRNTADLHEALVVQWAACYWRPALLLLLLLHLGPDAGRDTRCWVLPRAPGPLPFVSLVVMPLEISSWIQSKVIMLLQVVWAVAVPGMSIDLVLGSTRRWQRQ